jgi:hypothetical protein
MKKFEIIEEGRLNKSEMNQIVGGFSCQKNSYFVYPEENCRIKNVPSYSVCIGGYRSCTGDNNALTCSQAATSLYMGPTGPDGYTSLDNAVLA